MLPDKMERCIVLMNSWDVSGAFWSFSKCNITIPHLPADPSIESSDFHDSIIQWIFPWQGITSSLSRRVVV
jgi:hypothetical protein